jgi:hypothetical protein
MVIGKNEKKTERLYHRQKNDIKIGLQVISFKFCIGFSWLRIEFSGG